MDRLGVTVNVRVTVLALVFAAGGGEAECDYLNNTQLPCDSSVPSVTANSAEECCRICENNEACVGAVLCKLAVRCPVPRPLAVYCHLSIHREVNCN